MNTAIYLSSQFFRFKQNPSWTTFRQRIRDWETSVRTMVFFNENATGNPKRKVLCQWQQDLHEIMLENKTFLNGTRKVS